MRSKSLLLSYPVLTGIFCVLVFARISGAEDPDPCSPTAVCENSDAGTVTKDPTDCHNYYICITGGEGGNPVPSDNPIACSEGDYFDSSKGECSKETVPCVNTCASLDCPSECSPEHSTVAYPDDCTKYIVCLPDGQEIIAECIPEAPYFDGTQCSTDESQCCDICTPYCQDAFTEVMDPRDCSAYYLCLNDGPYVPTDSDHFYCDAGEYFDSLLGDCQLNEEGEVCQSLCNSTSTIF